jgi:hypothetical protein
MSSMDASAVAQHRDAVCDTADLLHAVADVENRDSGGSQRAEAREQELDLGIGERSGRLVEHEHSARPGEGGRHLHELLPADTKPANRRSWIQIRQADGGEGIGRFRVQPSIRHEPEPARQVVEKDILRHAERRDQVQLLHHELHAGSLGVALAPRRVAPAPQCHRPAIRGREPADDAGERRLPGAVGAHERVDLAAAQIEIDRRQHRHRVAFLDAAHAEERLRIGRRRHWPPAVIRSTGVCLSSGLASPRRI